MLPGEAGQAEKRALLQAILVAPTGIGRLDPKDPATLAPARQVLRTLALREVTAVDARLSFILARAAESNLVVIDPRSVEERARVRR